MQMPNASVPIWSREPNGLASAAATRLGEPKQNQLSDHRLPFAAPLVLFASFLCAWHSRRGRRVKGGGGKTSCAKTATRRKTTTEKIEAGRQIDKRDIRTTGKQQVYAGYKWNARKGREWGNKWGPRKILRPKQPREEWYSGLYRHRDGRIHPPQRARRRKMARRTKREMLQKQASPRAATRQPD